MSSVRLKDLAKLTPSERNKQLGSLSSETNKPSSLFELEEKIRFFENKYQIESKAFFDSKRCSEVEADQEFSLWMNYFVCYLDMLKAQNDCCSH